MLLNVQQERQAARLTQLSAQLEHAADHDSLTQLYNRRYLGRYLEGLLKEKAPFYLALLDLDWFKQINDKYGHAFGDQVLVEFARILSRCVAGHGIAVRFGGEEFMLVLSDCSQQRAMELLEQVRQDFLSFSQREKQTNFTFSCGRSTGARRRTCPTCTGRRTTSCIRPSALAGTRWCFSRPRPPCKLRFIDPDFLLEGLFYGTQFSRPRQQRRPLYPL